MSRTFLIISTFLLNSYKIFIETNLRASEIEISISDTGCGISELIKPRLFKEIINKGIGLLLAQVIIQSYKGEIILKNSSSEGTIMIIRLPLSRIDEFEIIKNFREGYL